MSYVALYRRFRPPVFDEVKGQEHVTRTLRNQVRTGRLQHAYLFCGTRGTGKTSVAKILARAVNCENPDDGNPCGTCSSCRAAAAGTSMNVIEIDAASNNGVDNIRELIEEVQYRPASGKYKVYIIDEVHMLSSGAFNALLKTLEEPPDYAIFILATTEAGRVPVTILSRCQRYDFRRIGTDTIVSRLGELLDREGIEAEEKALFLIASAADGSMRDALSILERCIAYYIDEPLTCEGTRKVLGEPDRTVFRQVTEQVLAGDAKGAVRTFGRQTASGVEAGQFVESWIRYLRDLLIVLSSSAPDAEAILGMSGDQLTDLLDTASSADADTLMRFIRTASDLRNRMRYSADRRTLAEITLIRLAVPESDPSSDALPGRVRSLERRLDEWEEGGYAVRIQGGRTLPDREPQEDRAPEEEGDVLPDAAPEDLRQICADWRHFLAGLPDGPLRTQLRADAVPQYNGDTLENRLYIELRSTAHSECMNRVLVNNDDFRQEIERQLEKRYGRRVEVELHLRENRAAGLRTVDVDRQLEALAGLGVEIDEEDDPDPF